MKIYTGQPGNIQSALESLFKRKLFDHKDIKR